MLLSVKAYTESCFVISTKKNGPCFFPIQKTNINFPLVSTHINTFVGFFALRKKTAYKHFGTSEFLIVFLKQAVVNFHLLKLAILEQCDPSV